ncbi:MAG: nucleotide exchange factor GrpE [Bacteroidota bacterium]
MSKKKKAQKIAEEPPVAVEDAQTIDITTTADSGEAKAEALSDEELQSEASELRAELEKEKDKFLRLFAEFENFKKRTSKERMDLFKTAGQEVMVALLPVLDDFDRALKEIAKTEEKELLKGVELIDGKLRETLKAKGLEQVAVEAGEVFDAEVHEAVTQIPVPDEKMKGKVVDIIEKGFKMGDRIIRHPKVVVGN